MLKKHLTFRQLYNYINTLDRIINDDTATDDTIWNEIYEIDNHIINCTEDCEENLIFLQKLYNKIGDMNINSNDTISESKFIDLALINAKIEAIEPSIKNRLKKWIDKYECKVEGAVKALINIKEDLFTITPNNENTILKKYNKFNFKNEDVVIPVRGQNAITIQDKTKATDQNNNLKIHADILNRSIIIKLTENFKEAPLVLLLNNEEKVKSSIFQFSRNLNDNTWELELKNLSSGVYIIAFEPTENISTL